VEILLGLIFWVAVGAGVKTAWDHGRADRQRSRQASVTKAAKKASPKDLTPAQRRVTTARHDIGWWASEALRGFPVHRTGWHHGWLEHKTDLTQRRAAREKARTAHVEAQADVAETLPGHRERQLAARQRIDQAQAQASPQEHKPGDAPGLPADAVTPPAASSLPPIQEPAWATRPAAPPGNSTAAVNGTAASPAPAEGKPVATQTETSYEEVITAAKAQAADAEGNVAALDQQITAAQALADAMLASEVDSASVSDQMDYIDKLNAARAAYAEAGEQAEAVDTNVQQRHGGIAEAVQDSPVDPAAMGFYQDA
jgi:hypothetical protein